MFICEPSSLATPMWNVCKIGVVTTVTDREGMRERESDASLGTPVSKSTTCTLASYYA